MKKSKMLALALSGIFVIATFGACTSPVENAQQATGIDTTSVTAPQGTTAPPEMIPGETTGRGMTLAINAETPSIAPARHGSLIAHWKNILTHNGIFRLDYNMNPTMDLVSEWRPISDTLFEFTLHEGIMFHNGEELTAYDVVASIYFVRMFPEGVANHGSVVGAEVVDRYTFILDTGVPNALMTFELAHQANFIMPKSLIESGHDFTLEPIGSGPFYFYEWNFGDSLVFNRFDDYFDSDRTAHLDYIIWRVIPEGAARTIALESGEIDYVIDVAFPDIPRLDANDNITVLYQPSLTYNYLLLNHNRPQFQNVYVRSALGMALDKEAMVLAAYDGWGIPVWEMMPMALAGSSAEGTRSFDPDGAVALLAEHNIDPATLSFDMIAYSEEKRRMAEVVQSNLADIGIETTISMIDFTAWMTVTGTGDYDAAFAAFTSGNIFAFLRSTMHIDFIGSQNRSGVYHRELSDIISQAVATIDEGPRLALMEEASRIANEYAVWVPTNMNVLVRAFNSSLVTPELAPNGFMFFNMMYWSN